MEVKLKGFFRIHLSLKFPPNLILPTPLHIDLSGILSGSLYILANPFN